MQTQPTDREKWKVLITDIKFNVEKRERCSYVWVCPPFRCCSCRCFATPLVYDAVVKLDSRLSALVFSSLVYAWSRLLLLCFGRTNQNGTSGDHCKKLRGWHISCQKPKLPSSKVPKCVFLAENSVTAWRICFSIFLVFVWSHWLCMITEKSRTWVEVE